MFPSSVRFSTNLPPHHQQPEKKISSIRIRHNALHSGVINLRGYKHAMVQVIAAAITLKRPVIIENPPLVEDTFVYCNIIERNGGKATVSDGALYIDPTAMKSGEIPFDLSRLIHGALYLMPSYAMRFGGFKFYGSGGCQIGGKQANGKRPVNHILSVMEKFGIEITSGDSVITGQLQHNWSMGFLDILEYSDHPSIMQGPRVGGATKAAILCGLHLDKVIIANPYLKTDVMDLLRFIELAGYQVNNQAGVLEISKLAHVATNEPIRFRLTPCISELITYVALAVHTGIELNLQNLDQKRIMSGLTPEFSLFDKMGLPYRWIGDNLHIGKVTKLNSLDIDVTPESIQSDHHPFFALMLMKGSGISRIREFVWYERFDYVEKLRALGAHMEQVSNSVVIKPSKIHIGSQNLVGMDVRTAAVILVAALMAPGETNIDDAQHLFRGYSREFIPNINALGGAVSTYAMRSHSEIHSK